jgi:RHS repeat-associated protein
MSENATLKYIHQACPERSRRNHLSGTSLMTSANGTLLGTIKYTPFGETRAGDVPTDKLFTGQRLDSTGLYYYGARYYDPTIGRFISADTIVPSPANPQSYNRYSYVLNNPLKYVDPSGHLVYDENGTPIDTSNPYWIENYVFAGGSLEDILTPTAAAWNDFVWSGNAAMAHTLERDRNIQVYLKYGDLGYGLDSAFRKGSNENEYTIILNNNKYRDISKADAFYRSGALLGQIYNIPGYTPDMIRDYIAFMAAISSKISQLPNNKALGTAALIIGIPTTVIGGLFCIAGVLPSGLFGEVPVAIFIGITSVGIALTVYGWNTLAGDEYKIYDGPLPAPF